jgi:hypothetical protein
VAQMRKMLPVSFVVAIVLCVISAAVRPPDLECRA